MLVCKFLLLLVLAFSPGHLGDECASICVNIPGSCSDKGSHCKQGRVCMDLFWFDEAKKVICNHKNTGCTDMLPLFCSEAISILSGDTELPGVPDMVAQAKAASRSRMTRRGIRNLGASCYFSSVLQVLTHSVALRELFSTWDRKDILRDASSAGIKVTTNFDSILNELLHDGPPVDTKDLLAAVREYALNDGMQESSADDASRAMSFIVNALSETIPHAIDFFTLRTSLESGCFACDYESLSSQPLVGPILLQLPLKAVKVHLYSLIQELLSPSVPEDFSCGGCQFRGTVKLSPVVTAAPPLLIFTLSRYVIGAEKNLISVEIPHVLNLGAISANAGITPVRLQYKLIGVVRHADCHYTCDFFDREEWFHANDASVASVDAPLKSGSDPFILVYERLS